jgi:hypothetical protein
MEKNVGSGDRVVRIIVGIALIALIYFEHLGDIADFIAGVAAAYLIGTALLSRCVVYRMAGIDTTTEENSYSTTDDRAGL